MNKKELKEKAITFESKLKVHPTSSAALVNTLCDFAESIRKQPDVQTTQLAESHLNMNRLSQKDKICCGVLERMNLGWMRLEDGAKCMPYTKGHSDDNMYRVNNCPSCGKYVRDVIIEP